jgi:hypothetical protein
VSEEIQPVKINIYKKAELIVIISIPMSVKRKKRGFALLSKGQLPAVASAGGKAVHAKGNAHMWTHAEAIKAGSKGGKKLKGSKWSRL